LGCKTCFHKSQYSWVRETQKKSYGIAGFQYL